jgi:chromosome segregation ATPase
MGKKQTELEERLGRLATQKSDLEENNRSLHVEIAQLKEQKQGLCDVILLSVEAIPDIVKAHSEETEYEKTWNKRREKEKIKKIREKIEDLTGKSHKQIMEKIKNINKRIEQLKDLDDDLDIDLFSR